MFDQDLQWLKAWDVPLTPLGFPDFYGAWGLVETAQKGEGVRGWV